MISDSNRNSYNSVPVGEEPWPVDLPVVDVGEVPEAAGEAALLLDDVALRGALVPAQPVLAHVQLHLDELGRSDVGEVAVHLVGVEPRAGRVLLPPDEDVLPLQEGRPLQPPAQLAIQ